MNRIKLFSIASLALFVNGMFYSWIVVVVSILALIRLTVVAFYELGKLMREDEALDMNGGLPGKRWQKRENLTNLNKHQKN